MRCRKDVPANIGADFRTVPSGGSWHSLTNGHSQKLRNAETSSLSEIEEHVKFRETAMFLDAPILLSI